MPLLAIRPALTALFTVCVLTALADALFLDARSSAGVRLVCGLSIALCIVQMAVRILT